MDQRSGGTEPGYRVWRKSSHSPSVNDCVEVADVAGGGREVRDSKLGDSSPVLAFSPSEWRAFILGANAGEFGTFV